MWAKVHTDARASLPTRITRIGFGETSSSRMSWRTPFLMLIGLAHRLISREVTRYLCAPGKERQIESVTVRYLQQKTWYVAYEVV